MRSFAFPFALLIVGLGVGFLLVVGLAVGFLLVVDGLLAAVGLAVGLTVCLSYEPAADGCEGRDDGCDEGNGDGVTHASVPAGQVVADGML